MSLTNTAIQNAKSGPKPMRTFDVRGLYLELSPASGKWWRLKYWFNGKEKRVSLGVYQDVSVKDARDCRNAARKLIAGGVDPSENRKIHKAARQERAASSFEVVAREWFAKYSKTWASRHFVRVVRLFEPDIFP